MFFIDDVMLSPFKGFLFIAQEVAKAVEQERENSRDQVMRQLSELHKRVESGELTDEEFEVQEADLLDLLESLDSH